MQTKNKLNTVLIIILLLLMSGLGAYILVSVNELNKETINNSETIADTVMVKHIETVKVIEKHVPYMVEVQREPDTALRAKAEKETIVTGVEFKKQGVEVSTVDTTGRVVREFHSVKPYESFKIDNTGAVEVITDKKKERKEKLKKIVRRAGIVTVIVISFIAGSKL